VNPADPVDLHNRRSEGETHADVAAIALPRDPTKVPVGSDVIFKELSDFERHKDSVGLGGLIAAVHHVARPFRNEDL
jgi:hypothetical protein